MNRSLLALALLIGFLPGLLVGAWAFRDGMAPRTPPPDLERSTPIDPDAAEVETSSELVSPGSRSPSMPEPRTPASISGAAGPSDRPVEGLFGAALLAHAAEGIGLGWRQLRPNEPSADEIEEGLDAFQARTLELPAAIGRELAERRSNAELAAEDARTGGVLVTLSRLEAGGPGPLFEIVEDRAAFDRFFQAETTGAAVDGPTVLSSRQLSKREPVADGSTLQFPAGVFQLEDFGRYWSDRFPRDITIRGAGQGATLLVLRSDLSARDTVRNLTVERCTLHANDNYLFDIRKPAMSLTLRDVRVTGWDMGAGGSCLFGTEGLALRAIDCKFLGGYGRSPGSGKLFDVRHNGLLARFERCLVERTAPFDHFAPGATVVFSACQLRDVWAPGEQVPKNVRLDGCNLEWYDRQNGPELGRDLNELFPDWKASIQR